MKSTTVWSSRPRAIVAAIALAVLVIPIFVQAAPAQSASPGALRGSNHPAPSAAVPNLQGPISGKVPLILAAYPLSKVGYSESEYFFSGTAKSYTSPTPLASSGKWSLQPGPTAAYKTRLVVIRPSNPAKFSGTVDVEWLNVSAGVDEGPDWLYGHDEMLRSGDAWVGVSAQAAGINSLKSSDPTRYGSLSSPGDSFSYDIFSQAGMAVRAKSSTLLPGMQPHVVIADGESQSAVRLATYVDGIAPLTNVFDGYLLHSRGSSGAPLSSAPQPVVNAPTVLRTRTDLTVPVLTFETESDVLDAVFPTGYLPATQPDSRYFRLWEVAGTSHIDSYNLSSLTEYDDGSWSADLQLFSFMSSPPSTIPQAKALGLNISCGGNGFNAGEEHYVLNTALHDLASWIETGVPPKPMPRFQINTSTNPATYKLDRNGNVLGGVRTPAVDAPVAVLSGIPPANSPGFCDTFGQTTPFTALQLAKLYPTHADFVHDWLQAVHKDTAAGALLPQDAQRLAELVGG